jgi:hypothetical protein
MEVFSGKISIKQIFIHRETWLKFWTSHILMLRWSVIWNAWKMLQCKNAFGHTEYICPKCKAVRRIPHTCKSRFCNSCGKAAVERWSEKTLTEILDVKYKHIVFTIPEQFRIWFRKNRKTCLNILFSSAKDAILEFAKEKGFKPGIICILHTFGADLKWNPHIHIIITAGGLKDDKTRWIKNSYFPQCFIRPKYRYIFLKKLKKAFKNNELQPPKSNSQIKTCSQFNSYLTQFYKNEWYVYFGKELKEAEGTVKYSGRYGKRPVIAESRITKFTGKEVTFRYKDRALGKETTLTLPVYEFIKRLIIHIPDNNFRVIRYSGIFAARVKSELLNTAETILNLTRSIYQRKSYRDMYRENYGHDPLKCSFCGTSMILMNVAPVNTSEIKLFCIKYNDRFKQKSIC